MIKKIIETKYKYDEHDNLIEKTETITEYTEEDKLCSPVINITCTPNSAIDVDKIAQGIADCTIKALSWNGK